MSWCANNMKFIAKSIFTAAAILFSCAALSAQQPVVETTGLYGGTTMQVRVSGDYPGQPAILLAGRPTVATNNALLGLQLVSPLQVFRGQLDSSGLYEFSVSLPPRRPSSRAVLGRA